MRAPVSKSTAAPDGLAGLGPKSRAMLAAAGITTPTQLRDLGSVRAYARVKAVPGNHASLNLLWALEGALTGEHGQVVAREHRLSLLLALEALAGTAEADTPPAGQRRRAGNHS